MDSIWQIQHKQSWLSFSVMSLTLSLSRFLWKLRRRSVVCTSYSCTFSLPSTYVSRSSGLALIIQTGPKNHITFIANIIKFPSIKKPSFFVLYMYILFMLQYVDIFLIISPVKKKRSIILIDVLNSKYFTPPYVCTYVLAASTVHADYVS